ncbi:MAG: type I pullulanase, partial [Bacteroidaceae bacterium]|nr:type I pullulanase [Bacteroidaceae bacterium]
CVVGWQLKDLRGIDTWSDIVVLLNSNKDKVECDIPEGWWTVVCRNSKINEGGMGTIHGGKVTVPAHSAMILHK